MGRVLSLSAVILLLWVGLALAAANVYYSVSPFGTGDIKTGSPTISISSGVATLSQAQTGNIGQGCRITYNGASVCYISGVTDSTHFSVVTALGETPADVSDQTVNSIAHCFPSLSAAITEASGAGYLNGTDLTALNVILNIACYYDHTDYTADSAAVSINGYTASATQFINIFTPRGLDYNESIYSQRHQGVWDPDKYFIEATNQDIFTANNNYLRVTGLQISGYSTTWYNKTLLLPATADYVSVDKCLLVNDCQFEDGGPYAVVMDLADDYEHVTNSKVTNCVLIAKNYTEYGLQTYCWSGLFENNTVYGGQYGVYAFFSEVSGASFSNNAVAGASIECFHDAGGGFVGDCNLSTDATAPGANSIHTAQTVAQLFTDAANGDFSIKDTNSDLYDAGTDLSAYFTTDIAGTTRSTWDIGAFEYVSGPKWNTITPAKWNGVDWSNLKWNGM